MSRKQRRNKHRKQQQRLIDYSQTYDCFYCGIELPPGTMTVDHVMPIGWGGLTELDNLVPACHQCNKKKKNRLLCEMPTPHPVKMKGALKHFVQCHDREPEPVELAAWCRAGGLSVGILWAEEFLRRESGSGTLEDERKGT